MKISVPGFQFPQKSFTLFEVLIVVAILVVLTVIALPNFRFFGKESDLNNSTEEIINTLRLAQNKTLASEDASKYGVFFDDSTDPHQYTLFKTLPPLFDYVSRDINSDEIHQISKSVEIYEINLAGGGQEVVFNRLTGETDQFGRVSLRLKSDFSKTRTVGIGSSGKITTGEESTLVPLPTNIDSRHVHIDYSRFIDTLTENLTLTFPTDPTKNETIIITDNIKDGQIYWESKVDAGLKIHTHTLNTGNTQFCIHRDRRYNTKTLRIEISGDSSGYLIEYSADGLTTTKTSIHASDPQWQ